MSVLENARYLSSVDTRQHKVVLMVSCPCHIVQMISTHSTHSIQAV